MKRISPQVEQEISFLRSEGFTYQEIQQHFPQLNLPKSTISTVLHRIRFEMPTNGCKILQAKQAVTRKKNQILAVKKNKQNREKKLRIISNNVARWIIKNQITYTHFLTFLAGLYLGEGIKKDNVCMLANSNPKIIQVFIKFLQSAKGYRQEKISIQLHLRADQDPNEMKKYWAKILNIDIQCFQKCQTDKRTIHSKTIDHYKGVCAIYYFDARIQKYLLELQNQFLEYLLNGRLAQW